MGGLHIRCGKSCPPAGFDSQTLQLVVSCHTHYTIPAHLKMVKRIICKSKDVDLSSTEYMWTVVGYLVTLNHCKLISDYLGAVFLYFQLNMCTHISCMACPVPLLWQLIASLSTQKPGFNPRPVQKGFVVAKVARRQVPLPCQYHYTNAQCSLIHKFSTICTVYNPTVSLHNTL
jgi:hypothetical protein